MITKKTVLVLGAGASKPYGFPTAVEIGEEIYKEHLEDGGELSTLMIECGFVADEVRRFRRTFKESGHYSLDAFVQRRSEFRAITKVALAGRLIACEMKDEAGKYPPQNDDWYRFLFAGMMPPKQEDFVGNHLTVVTFNFDRSFEHRLMRVLEGNYGCSPDEVRHLAKLVPILHVHGQLGFLDASKENYRAYGAVEEAKRVAIWSKQIRLVDDEIDKEVLGRAVTALHEAETIWFIGFSFHPDNLGRLQAHDLGNQTLYGTCMGMSGSDLARVYKFFNSPRKGYLFDRTARSLFDVVDLS